MGAIKFVSASNLKDDWFALGAGSPQEPDPLVNCVFKTEFFTHLRHVTRGSSQLQIGDTVNYQKKPGKPATIKAIKDPAIPRDDLYKSGTIHTAQGERPDSVSKKTPKGRQVAAKPITKGKLVRPGAANGGPSKLASRPAPQSRPMPQAAPAQQSAVPQPAITQPRAVPQPMAAQSRVVPQPAVTQPRAVPQPIVAQSRAVPVPASAASAAVVNGQYNHSRNISTQSTDSNISSRPTPPPPPPAAAPQRPAEPTYRAMYDFAGQTPGELSLKENEVVIITQKESNGESNQESTGSEFHANLLIRLVASQTPERLTSRLGTVGLPRRSHQKS